MMVRQCRRMLGMAALFLIVASCVSMNQFGAIRGNSEVTQSFKNYEVSSQYRYYTIGPGGQPTAILGIDREYSLNSSIWQAVELTPEMLKTMVDLVNLGSPDKDRYWGSVVLDNAGNTVGVFYSTWRKGIVKVSQDKTVMVSPDKSSTFKGPRALRSGIPACWMELSGYAQS
ncbi:MAG: hypothetical protein JEZ02_06920 [Desulfatibacillum sp.]|nr:hypothetical protein [Desulfatibacillum sp.]